MEKNTKSRLREMLERDKEEMNEASKKALIADFRRVANEYFDAEQNAKIAIRRVKGGYEVNFSFRAHRVKNFSTLS